MLDWRGVLGTSFVNGGLAVMLAGLTPPIGWTCADCGGGWWFSDPEIPSTFDMPLRITVLPVEAAMQPVVAADSPDRIHIVGLCPGQPPVDRLPAVIESRAVVLPAVIACMRVDAEGRVERVRTFGSAPSGTEAALQRLAFVPAVRDGVTVASWVEVRGRR